MALTKLRVSPRKKPSAIQIRSKPVWKNKQNFGQKPNRFTNSRLVRTEEKCSESVKYLHFTEEISNYGHLSDSPLPITPWYSLNDFQEVMSIIYESVFEVPKHLPPDRRPQHLYELFIKPEFRDRIVYARLKVRTWRMRTMNIDEAQFLNEFLSCLERLLNYLIAKSFQRVRLGPSLYGMRTLVITGFITSLESTLTTQSYLGRSLKATKLFSCPNWILQIRHKLSHSNLLISDDILEDAISMIFAWFRKNFEFHLIKMPSETYKDNEDFYQHRSFSDADFNNQAFRAQLVDEFFGKLNENEEANFLENLRHFARYDLNKFLSYLVRSLDAIMLLKPEADFQFFAPTLMKMVKGIFKDTPSHIFCLKFLNKLLDQVILYETAIKNCENLQSKKTFSKRMSRVYNFIHSLVKTIIGRNQKKTNFFRIYLTKRKSDTRRWCKLCIRFLQDVDHIFPETAKLMINLFILTGEDVFTSPMKAAICKNLVEKSKQIAANSKPDQQVEEEIYIK